jgi:hypothetical protein
VRRGEARTESGAVAELAKIDHGVAAVVRRRSYDVDTFDVAPGQHERSSFAAPSGNEYRATQVRDSQMARIFFDSVFPGSVGINEVLQLLLMYTLVAVSLVAARFGSVVGLHKSVQGVLTHPPCRINGFLCVFHFITPFRA